MDNGWIGSEHSPIAAGDEDDMILVWHTYHGVMVERRSRYHDNRFYSHWMEIDNRKWISITTRKPTKEDADVYSCVIARNRWGETMTAGWHRFRHESDLVAWQHPPEAPDNYRELRDRT